MNLYEWKNDWTTCVYKCGNKWGGEKETEIETREKRRGEGKERSDIKE